MLSHNSRQLLRSQKILNPVKGTFFWTAENSLFFACFCKQTDLVDIQSKKYSKCYYVRLLNRITSDRLQNYCNPQVDLFQPAPHVVTQTENTSMKLRTSTLKCICASQAA